VLWLTGSSLWFVRPDDEMHGNGIQDRMVIHLDLILCATHLMPVYGSDKIPIDFHYNYSLDAFAAYYVNKYADHHAHEIAF
jgi:hypothetical protein